MNEKMGSKCYIVLHHNDISYLPIAVTLILSYMYTINHILKKDTCLFENIYFEAKFNCNFLNKKV